jgi:hypothetical protein
MTQLSELPGDSWEDLFPLPTEAQVESSSRLEDLDDDFAWEREAGLID